jgi:hypothetical protein
MGAGRVWVTLTSAVRYLAVLYTPELSVSCFLVELLDRHSTFGGMCDVVKQQH